MLGLDFASPVTCMEGLSGARRRVPTPKSDLMQSHASTRVSPLPPRALSLQAVIGDPWACRQ